MVQKLENLAKCNASAVLEWCIKSKNGENAIFQIFGKNGQTPNGPPLGDFWPKRKNASDLKSLENCIKGSFWHASSISAVRFDLFCSVFEIRCDAPFRRIFREILHSLRRSHVKSPQMPELCSYGVKTRENVQMQCLSSLVMA